ncbi:RNA polymerase II transcription factor [Xylona heveae TC161]|uniref:RNA polymerase II transcription factor n=1 Tax=Xylona heveae (strain CBS 132557 / TC161) TaxID=1328760 RepID=A0A165IFZ7_XYLHT|nr:RNA polymerase II transcription factor [Xylona heveae TC161]KZF24843.1 RNA polymerase II transcription factor [Xylona heveae TC161]
MATPRGSATYKKREGTLSLSQDHQYVSWTPVAPPGASPALTLTVATITNLQQTPATSEKVALRIFTQPQGAAAQEQHVFSFTSRTAARAEANAIKDALSASIQTAKSGSQTPAAAGGGGGGQSAAMAIASAISSTAQGTRAIENWFDDSRLKSDVELQQSLLKSDPGLQKTFVEALRTKPESITNFQFTSQFWSTRLHLLRAHAVERNQTRGSQNVLSTIKPKTIDNALRLNITKGQIQQIFNQHPLVKRAYDENVPKVSEEAFWSSFFQSRLFKKLKGEKITENDPTDPVLDRYLREDDQASRLLGEIHVPHIIDIEGNEENHSQRRGNLPDLTMRPSTHEKVPILRAINHQSEMLMRQVAKIDVDPSQPIGMDEVTFNELALRDLRGDAEENRIILNIKDQKRFFSDADEDQVSADALLYSRQDPSEVLGGLRMDLDPALMESDSGGGLDLENALGVNDDSESEPEHDGDKTSHVGSKANLMAASSQIFDAIKQRRSQTDDFSSTALGFSTVQASAAGLSPTLFDRLSLTHATTTEFLHYFWLVFLSGDADRAGEVGQMVESLKRAIERVKAVANDAEKERNIEVETLQKQVREREKRTGRRIKANFDSIGGGAKVVNEMLGPTVRAVDVALAEYSRALAAEGLEMAR